MHLNFEYIYMVCTDEPSNIQRDIDIGSYIVCINIHSIDIQCS